MKLIRCEYMLLVVSESYQGARKEWEDKEGYIDLEKIICVHKAKLTDNRGCKSDVYSVHMLGDFRIIMHKKEFERVVENYEEII